MLPPVTSALATPSQGGAATSAPVAARRSAPEESAAVVTVSAAGARAAASQDTAKVATGIVQVAADVNHDGTVSDQEQLTDDAQVALKKAMLEGGPDLDQALQAYQTIASLADAQR